MAINHWSHANAFADAELPDEGLESEAFDTHYGNSVQAFGTSEVPVVLQASMDGEHWFNAIRAEPDSDGHFHLIQGDWVARYARLCVPALERPWPGGDGRPRITATLLGKTV